LTEGRFVAMEEHMSTPPVSLQQVLELAVATEARGAQYYQQLSEKFSSEQEVAAIFARLSQDERSHEATFRKLLAGAPPDKSVAPEDDSYLPLRAAATSDFFQAETLSDLSRLQTAADALTHALQFEKATLFYYQAAKDALGVGAELDELIAAERAHMTALMRTIISDAKFRGLADPW
jgi:rubrerythrin